MDGHFCAFSFVDRITQPGVHVRGVYQIPSGISEFPISLVAEACGQLAAWMAMATLDFKLRPVAGIAPVIELLGSVHPGQTLELASDIESLDAEAVAYSSVANVNGTPVLRLQHCVGPMVPLEDYDDPVLVKARYELLCGAGATPGAFRGVPPLALEYTGGEIGKSASAILRVPPAADFFADHFPHRQFQNFVHEERPRKNRSARKVVGEKIRLRRHAQDGAGGLAGFAADEIHRERRHAAKCAGDRACAAE